jgi:hypothetical protein
MHADSEAPPSLPCSPPSLPRPLLHTCTGSRGWPLVSISCMCFDPARKRCRPSHCPHLALRSSRDPRRPLAEQRRHVNVQCISPVDMRLTGPGSAPAGRKDAAAASLSWRKSSPEGGAATCRACFVFRLPPHFMFCFSGVTAL